MTNSNSRVISAVMKILMLALLLLVISCEDNEGKMNLNCLEAGGSTLCVSQFTLLGNVRRGNRPSFKLSAQSKEAYPILKHFCSSIRDNGLRCAEGEFGSNMSVQSVNYGPLTLVIDSNDLKLPRRS